MFPLRPLVVFIAITNGLCRLVEDAMLDVVCLIVLAALLLLSGGLIRLCAQL
jgi:hypothetical protein